MMYLLDTNTCIGYLSGRASGVVRKMETLPVDAIAVCAVVKAELFYGAMRSVDPERALSEQQLFLNQFVSLSFDDRAAVVYGRIRAALFAAGTPIGPNDLLIAAIALAHSLTLVTHNTREFQRVSGLRIEDWEA